LLMPFGRLRVVNGRRITLDDLRVQRASDGLAMPGALVSPTAK
jgi:hypothetical protein